MSTGRRTAADRAVEGRWYASLTPHALTHPPADPRNNTTPRRPPVKTTTPSPPLPSTRPPTGALPAGVDDCRHWLPPSPLQPTGGVDGGGSQQGGGDNGAEGDARSYDGAGGRQDGWGRDPGAAPRLVRGPLHRTPPPPSPSPPPPSPPPSTTHTPRGRVSTARRHPAKRKTGRAHRACALHTTPSCPCEEVDRTALPIARVCPSGDFRPNPGGLGVPASCG